MSEIVKVQDNQLLIEEEAMAKLRMLPELEILKETLRNELLNAMKNNGIKSFENDDLKITYKEATTRKSVDTKALKEQGLYESFLKESPVKESVAIEWK